MCIYIRMKYDFVNWKLKNKFEYIYTQERERLAGCLNRFLIIFHFMLTHCVFIVMINTYSAKFKFRFSFCFSFETIFVKVERLSYEKLVLLCFFSSSLFYSSFSLILFWLNVWKLQNSHLAVEYNLCPMD